MPTPDNNPESREELLFAAALDLPASQRRAYLDCQCGGDAAMRRRVEDLLKALDSAGDLLEEPLTGVAVPSCPGPGEGGPAIDSFTENVGDRIGRYKLIQEIGVGGCGVVYLAEQEVPVRRQVALKLIKLGMDTRQVVARFEAERQALALMEHPNIARILDAGASNVGRPYFVMELVRGVRITEYCDEHKLNTRERLELFSQVCSAIEHAHQKGIIHRDLKPSNVLVAMVDGAAVLKVIDFGIAKATGQERLTDKTIFTAADQLIGTPAYMSPEQVEMTGSDVDTRTDIYSLGVLLYELLTGTTPFESDPLLRSGIDGIRRIFREQEAPTPSRRLTTMVEDHLTTVAGLRRTGAPQLLHTIRGDLDWIVMKAMEKDRARRYESATGLAQDVQRYLKNEAVLARPPSTAYLFRKLVQRHKLAFAAGSVVVAALLFGLGFSTISFVRERRARTETEERRKEAETARANEASQRKLAEQQRVLAEENARKASESALYSARLLYAADINLAQQSISANNLGRARRLLDFHRPGGQFANGELAQGTNTAQPSSTPTGIDLRGWEWRYLWQQCRSDALEVLPHFKPSGVFTVGFSRDGTRLAVGFFNGRVEIWDFPARKLIKVLNPNGGQYGNLVFSPRNDILVVTENTGIIKLHDLATGKERGLCDAKAFVRDLSFTDDGKYLTVLTIGSRTQGVPVFVWDVDRGEAFSSNRVSTADRKFSGTARLSPDHQRLYLGREEKGRNMLQCVRMPDWGMLWEAEGEQDVGFTAMALSPDGRFLATAIGYAGMSIRVWNAMTGRLEAKLEGHSAYVGWLAFSPNGRQLASASSDQTIRLWDAATWKESAVLRGHGDEVHALAFSPDGRFLASGSKEGMVMLWDASLESRTHGPRVLPPDTTYAITVPGASALARMDTRNRWSMLDLKTRQESPLDPKIEPAGTNGVFARVQAKADALNKMPVSGNFENRARIGNEHVRFVSSREFELQSLLEPGKPPVRIYQGGVIYRMAVSPDNRTFAVSSQSGIVGLYDAERKECLQVLHGHLKAARGVAFTPDGRRLASASGGAEAVKIWSAGTGRELLTLSGKSDLLDFVDFSDDGSTLLVGSQGRTGWWEYWRAPSWQEIEDTERTHGIWPQTATIR